MKKLLYLRTDLGTRELISGGSVTHTLGVLDGFIMHGSTIYCASSALHPILLQKKDICFMPLAMPTIGAFLGFKINCLLSNIWFLSKILWFVRSKQIECVYQRYSMLNAVGIMIAKIKRIPLILEFNGSESWVDTHWSPRKKINLNWLVALFESWNVRYADYIVVVSQVLKDMLVSRGVDSKKIIVNPNGVDEHCFDPEKYQNNRKELRIMHGIDDKYVFGFIGSFSYWHGVEMISKIIPRIAKLYPQVHFLLIGTGPLISTMKNDIAHAGFSEQVTFVGAIPYTQAPEYLSMCDAYLCPSQHNSDGTPFFGSPTKLFEYMSMARPIIASDVEQLREIVDSSFGILVLPYDEDGFVSAACTLIQHAAEKQKHMGQCARNKAIKQYSWRSHVSAIMTYINNK